MVVSIVTIVSIITKVKYTHFEKPTVQAPVSPKARAVSRLYLTPAAMAVWKAGPSLLGALHCLRLRHPNERCQYNCFPAIAAHASTASHRPSRQMISHGRFPQLPLRNIMPLRAVSRCGRISGQKIGRYAAYATWMPTCARVVFSAEG